MKPSEKKSERLLQIEALLLHHPEGLTQSEIARRLQVNRSTINRYISSLPGHVYLDDNGRFYIDRDAYLVNVRLSLHEATAIHLATRLLETRMDRQNPHAASALRKLSIALQTLAPRISQHLCQSAEAMDDRSRHYDPVYLQALEKLTLGWAEGRKVQIWYRSDDEGEVHTYQFAPYFIEPYAIGQTTYVFGWRDPPGAIRTFKVERIERIEILRETYSIPESFNPQELLADAWGIWYTDGEPVEVVLKFSPRSARRVKETRWHRSEQISDLEDGGLLWKAWIAEPKEMLPWIRGWGADVEVIEPDSLKASLKYEAQQLMQLYQVDGMKG